MISYFASVAASAKSSSEDKPPEGKVQCHSFMSLERDVGHLLYNTAYTVNNAILGIVKTVQQG